MHQNGSSRRFSNKMPNGQASSSIRRQTAYLHCATHTLPYIVHQPHHWDVGFVACVSGRTSLPSSMDVHPNGTGATWYRSKAPVLAPASRGWDLLFFLSGGSRKFPGNPDRNGFRNGFRLDGWTMLDRLATLKTPRRKVSLRCMRHPWSWMQHPNLGTQRPIKE